MDSLAIKPRQILTSPFWSEPIEVLWVRPQGERLEVIGVGAQTKQYYSLILSPQELAQVKWKR